MTVPVVRSRKSSPKKITKCCSAVLAAAFSFTQVCGGMTAFASTYSKVRNGVYQLSDGTELSGVYARGIDVSHWQGEIDWEEAADDDVTFVMLGVRYSGDVDPYFRSFASEASAAGIQLGAYIYSYAQTVEEAEAEADFVLDLVKDYPISYPIAFDMEDSSQASFTSDELADLANAFCAKIEEAGYYPIIYANDNWLANKLDMSKMDYDVWVARYETMYEYSAPVMWQATSSGSVNGVSGGCDIDFQFRNFSDVISADLWRTIDGATYYYQDYTMQKSTWIHDGTGWFYLNSEGHPYTGWLTQNGKTYYLDLTSARMVEGWQETANGWMYFGTDGAMRTGWVSEQNTWYYLNSAGVMQTGWISDNGARYYLDGSGVMQVGWLNDGGSWYYLNGSGAMQTGWLNDSGTWYYLNSSGVMQTGWLNDNGVRYYLDPSSGAMVANTQITVDGVNYQVSADGSCTEIVAESAAEGEPSAAENTEMAVGTTGTLPGNGEAGAGESSTAPAGSTSTTASVSGLPLIAAFPY